MASRVRPLASKFTPSIVSLEDRTTPATFYVDPLAVDLGGGVATFNAGNPGQVTGLALNTQIFTTFNAALTAANTTAGADTIELSYGTIDINNSAGTLLVTDPLTLHGSGSGATRLVPTNNTVDEFGPDAAVLRVDGSSNSLNISDLALDGNAPTLQVGQFVRWQNGAKGNVTRTTSSYVVYTPTGFNSGAFFVATDAGTVVNVSNSTLDSPGAVGVGYQLGASGSVSGNNFLGGGVGNFVIYGVQVGEGSTNVTISGNTFQNFSGADQGVNGAGVLVASVDPITGNFGPAAFATIIGNTFNSNITAIIVGTPDGVTGTTLDPNANALIQHNNITGNDTAIVTDVASTTVVNALYNWWGDVTGPHAVGNLTTAGDNLTSPANPVGVNTLWRDGTINPFSGVLQSKTPQLTATSSDNYISQLPKATVTVAPVTASPTNATPVEFKITFSEAVSAFDLTDVTFTTAVGGTAVLLDSAHNPVTATTRDTVFFVDVTGMTGTGNITVNVPAATLSAGLFSIRTDLFGGTAAAAAPATIKFDNVAPTISASSPSGFPVNTGTSPAGFVVTFSEPVTGFTASDVVLSGTALRGGETVTVTPADLTGTVYNVTVNNLTKLGDVNILIPTGAASDAAGNGSTEFKALPAINFTPQFSRGFVAGGDVGLAQPYFGVDQNYATQTGIVPFSNTFTGGVRVAKADINNDGTLDVVVGTGVGTRAQVKVYDGKTTLLLGKMDVFESSFSAGIFVAAADVNGDGMADVAVSADVGGSSRVEIFDGKTFLSTAGANPTIISNFFSIEGDPNFRGGVRIALGDVNKDGRADLVVGAGFGGGPRVATYSGATLGVNGGPKLFNDYFAFSPTDALTLRNGVFVAVGDINGDGYGDIVTGAGDGGAPRVQTYSGKDLLSNTFTRLTDFFASNVNGGSNNTGGARVAVANITGTTSDSGNTKMDIVVGPGRSGGAVVGVFNATNPNLIPPGGNLTADKTLDLFGNFVDGVFVG
ncbi:MAG: VCBS repeat-containing protein [Gemmataceae bacterium]